MKKIILIGILFLFLFVSIGPVLADNGLIPCGGNGQSPCTLCDFLVLFQNIVNFLLLNPGIVPILAGLMLAVAGVMFFLGGVDQKLINQAKELLKAIVIGLIIIYGAFLIVNAFFWMIGLNGTSGFDLKNWNNIQCE